MASPRASFSKDHEDIVQKFSRLVADADTLSNLARGQDGSRVGTDEIAAFFALRMSAMNLIARVAGTQSIYYKSLQDDDGPARLHFTPGVMLGIIRAAMNDFREGFIADAKLLVSAEVFADFLVQAEVLLEHDYKDAAAVIIRAVLEDGLRRVCDAKGINVRDRAGVDDLAIALAKHSVITAVQKKEVDAKREIGNAAAHGRFGEFTKQDVIAFHEFVQRLLATLI